jgi:hypothetical protein
VGAVFEVARAGVAVVGVLVIGLASELTVAAVAPKVERFGPTGGLTTAVANRAPKASGFSKDETLVPGLAVLGCSSGFARCSPRV